MCHHCGCTQPLDLDLLAEDRHQAEANRRWLDRHRITAIELLSSPGSGKTTLLEATLRHLAPHHPLAVIEGDPHSDRDRRRIQALGVPSLQINTGAACHLDAARVGDALRRLRPPTGAYLFVENVGNLICPTDFPLGTHARVLLFSVTEGEDKPLKYPNAFASADLILITKADLLPHLDFSLAAARTHLRHIAPDRPHFLLSARTGAGLASWLDWLARRRPR